MLSLFVILKIYLNKIAVKIEITILTAINLTLCILVNHMIVRVLANIGKFPHPFLLL
jgi:hypothetical protein